MGRKLCKHFFMGHIKDNTTIFNYRKVSYFDSGYPPIVAEVELKEIGEIEKMERYTNQLLDDPQIPIMDQIMIKSDDYNNVPMILMTGPRVVALFDEELVKDNKNFQKWLSSKQEGYDCRINRYNLFVKRHMAAAIMPYNFLDRSLEVIKEKQKIDNLSTKYYELLRLYFNMMNNEIHINKGDWGDYLLMVEYLFGGFIKQENPLYDTDVDILLAKHDVKTKKM